MWFHDEKEQQQQRKELLIVHLNIQFVCTTNNIILGSLHLLLFDPHAAKMPIHGQLDTYSSIQQQLSGNTGSPTKGASPHQLTSKTATKW